VTLTLNPTSKAEHTDLALQPLIPNTNLETPSTLPRPRHCLFNLQNSEHIHPAPGTLILVGVLLFGACYLSLRLEGVSLVSYNRGGIESGKCVVLEKSMDHKVLIVDTKDSNTPAQANEVLSKRQDLYRAEAQILMRNARAEGQAVNPDPDTRQPLPTKSWTRNQQAYDWELNIKL